jgi:three-Cys-motif partner protein
LKDHRFEELHLAKKAHVDKSVGPWAKQKLDALESYLTAYMQVMKKQKFKLFYIDAFAGAGIVRVRTGEQTGRSANPADALIPEVFDQDDQMGVEEYITGSPLRALNLDRPFDHYRFIDLDPKRVADLENLAEEFHGCDVKVKVGEANEAVQFIASKFLDKGWRGVAFLDPYGAHLHWATLEALARTRKFDVIINFPLGMTINRLVMRRADEIRTGWAEQLDLCFGTSAWRELAFSTETDLLGEVTVKREDAGQQLLAFYTHRLEQIFGFVATPSVVKNTKGSPLYYLIWASSNERGKSIADHILRLGERVSLPRKARKNA